MSLRSTKKPIVIPQGVNVELKANLLTVKGSKGSLELAVNKLVDIKVDGSEINVSQPVKNDNKFRKAITGTTCSHIKNMLAGVTNGFEKKLILVGVGYRAQQKGKGITLSLGYSHPIEFNPPEGITIELPSQTEIIIKGCDKQIVGQVAANIRSYRQPEPYKGKGIKYHDEVIIRKETKKK